MHLFRLYLVHRKEFIWRNWFRSMAKKSMMSGLINTMAHCTSFRGLSKWIRTLAPLRKKRTSSSLGVWGELLWLDYAIHIYSIHRFLLRIEMGSFGSLQVDERFQRRGLGSLMAKLMAKQLAEMNIDSTAGIVDSNYKSRQMFQKLGFKHIDNTHWFTVSPSIPNFRWVD